MSAFVRGVMAAASASGVSAKQSYARVLTGTAVPPAKVMHGA